MYFPAVLRILGMSLMNCYKVLSVTCTFATAVLGYLSFSRLLNSRMAGLLAAVLYTLNPYRLACVYERSALGEYLAMTFLPMVLYGLYALLFGKKQDWKWLCLGATGVLQSHILTTEIAAAVCALTALVCVRRLFTRERRWIELLKTAAACVLLNFWFLIPFALMSLQLNVAVFTRDPQLSINAIHTMHELFSMVFVLILRPNDSGVGNNGFGFVNLFALALFVVYLLVFVGVRKMDGERRRLVRLGSVMALGALALGFATTDLFPWAEIQSVHWISKLVGALQFPFRLFSVMMLFFAALTGVVVLLWTRTASQRAAAALLAVVFAAFSANIYLDYAVEYTAIPHMATQSEFKMETATSRCIALAEYVPGASSMPDLFSRGTAVTTSDASITVTGVHRNGTSVSFDYTIEPYQEGGEYYVLAPLTYYPGYTAEINGVQYGTYADDANYVRIDLPAAAGHVELSYQDPTTFAAANAVSVLTAAFLIVSWTKPEWLRGAAARLRRRRA